MITRSKPSIDLARARFYQGVSNARIAFNAMSRRIVPVLGALTVVTLYLVIPTMIAASALVPGKFLALLTALVALALGQAVVFAVLRKTTPPHERETLGPERRATHRRQVAFPIEIEGGTAHPRGTSPRTFLGWAADIGAGGMALLVEPSDSVLMQQDIRVRLHLPGQSIIATTRLVLSEPVTVNQRQWQRLRLRLHVMDHADRERYHLAIAGTVLA